MRIAFSLCVALFAGTAVLAQPTPVSIEPMDEAHFLAAAADAAQTGDRDGTVQLYQSAIIYAPSDPVPYQQLGQFFAQRGELELAQRYFGLALDVQPAYAPALAGIAMLNVAAGDRKGAEVQHNILLHACGAKCPETSQVEKAISGMDSGPTAK
jgi:Flp pilus assembly protein TadD